MSALDYSVGAICFLFQALGLKKYLAAKARAFFSGAKLAANPLIFVIISRRFAPNPASPKVASVRQNVTEVCRPVGINHRLPSAHVVGV
ncbi:hypothetical protein [uncultured Pseudomonas sp.]|uniref:hypothetical protein n=1 Tax=uncultured Pseudomonas sp. TaxID=114707 RepID=UPI0025E7D6BB|nr:hypothetical protein [uncultured Pseudomonas sp.]